MPSRSDRPKYFEGVDDAEFIHDLSADADRLARAKRGWPRGAEAAKRLVVEHFLTRRGPRWLFDYRSKAAKQFPTRNYFWGEAITLDEAAAVLTHRVRDPNCKAGYHDLGPDVDWRRGRIHQYGSSGWLVLHFWYWGLFAAAGYAMTRDPRYVGVFRKCWDRWHEDFPFYVEPEVVKRGGAFSRADSCMRAGRRLLVLTDVLYSGLLAELDVDAAFDALKYLWFVSRQYLRLPMTPSGRFVYRFSNHNLFDMGTTPYCVGMMFPEFSHCGELVRLGKACIRRHVKSSIHAEGTSLEHSSRYAWYIANMHVQALEIARLNRDELLLPVQERKLRKFLWTLVELSAPDGRLIPYGDCQPPPESLHLRSYRTLFSDHAVRARARAMRVKLGRPYAPASVAKHDDPPGLIERASKVFRQSGMVVVRDGLGPDSSLLWIVADPRVQTAHGHLDFTSFQLWARGEPLVQDTSGYAYRIENVLAGERAFYYSPLGHSLLTVDDYSPVPMARMGNIRGGWWGNEIPETVIEEADIHGVRGRVSCSHQAYPGIKVHRTFEFDLSERRVEVSDRVTVAPRARGLHTFRQAFHLGFGMVPRANRPEQSARVEGKEAAASFAWETSGALAISARKSKLVKRAAAVFGLPEPYVLTAEMETDSPHVSMSCRIMWD